MRELYLDIFHKIDFKRIIDHPNILIAAAFWEEDRYLAARTCYRYMRAIDDLIDCHKSVHATIDAATKERFLESVHQWIAVARNQAKTTAANHELIETIRKFHIPAWPLEDFARAMIYDIDHSGFATLDDFMQYARGASVAPASIFVHLNGLISEGDSYLPPSFDVKEAATPCAMFSYLVHIIRDFQKDQLNNLNYFADDIVNRNGLCAADLRQIAGGGSIPAGFRNIIREYYELAGTFREQTFGILKKITPLLEPRYRLSLLVIFNLYLMVYERIDAGNGRFTTVELNPTPDEIKERVLATIEDFED